MPPEPRPAAPQAPPVLQLHPAAGWQPSDRAISLVAQLLRQLADRQPAAPQQTEDDAGG